MYKLIIILLANILAQSSAFSKDIDKFSAEIKHAADLCSNDKISANEQMMGCAKLHNLIVERVVQKLEPSKNDEIECTLHNQKVLLTSAMALGIPCLNGFPLSCKAAVYFVYQPFLSCDPQIRNDIKRFVKLDRIMYPLITASCIYGDEFACQVREEVRLRNIKASKKNSKKM